MAQKKADDKTAAEKKKISAINFKCSAELKRDLEDLAHLSRRDVSSILVEICSEFVKVNRTRITNFRRQAAQPIKLPTFATPTKKTSAPTSNATAGTASDEGGESA